MHRNVAAHGEVSNLGDSLILEKDICSHPFVVLSSYSFSSPTWQWRWERRRSQVECSSPGYLGVQTLYLGVETLYLGVQTLCLVLHHKKCPIQGKTLKPCRNE